MCFSSYLSCTKISFVNDERHPMRLPQNAVALFCSAILLCSCAQPLVVEKSDDVQIVSSEKNLLLINHTRWDVDIRRALTKAGFNVKKFASTKEVEVNRENISERFHKAEAKYGITQYPGGLVDRCILNKSIKFDEYAFEVSDLNTNDVIMTISKGGWTGDCGFHSGDLFDELSSSLADNWR